MKGQTLFMSVEIFSVKKYVYVCSRRALSSKTSLTMVRLSRGLFMLMRNIEV